MGARLRHHRPHSVRGVRGSAPRGTWIPRAFDVEQRGERTAAVSFSPAFRKLVLTLHITGSVGWLGAVAGFLALGIAGLSDDNAMMTRAAYLGMRIVGWYVIVPLCGVSLVTGVAQALGTPWGLFHHYWVL